MNQKNQFGKVRDVFAITKEELDLLRSKISSTKVSAKSRTRTKVFTENP